MRTQSIFSIEISPDKGNMEALDFCKNGVRQILKDNNIPSDWDFDTLAMGKTSIYGGWLAEMSTDGERWTIKFTRSAQWLNE